MSSSPNGSSPIHPPNQGPFKRQESLNEERHEIDGRGALGYFDVFSLIVNKMVGTGIYTAPASVFLMTGNKALTLGLFGVGFAYTLVSMMMYLDYAKVLPFNGGELIYIDEVTSCITAKGNIELQNMQDQSRQQQPPRSNTRSTTRSNTPSKPGLEGLWGDGLLLFVIYSISFMIFFNSSTNAMQIGRMVLTYVVANNQTANRSDIENDIASGINNDVMRFIGVFVIAMICLLQYFSPNFGRGLNKTIAIVKIAMLFCMFVVACYFARHKGKDQESGKQGSEGSSWYEFNDVNQKLSTHDKGVSFAKALLAVLFSYEGWENATFVTGEIPTHKHRVLRIGFISAVLTVGGFYMAIVSAFLCATDWPDLVSEPKKGSMYNTTHVPIFIDNHGNPESIRAWSIMAAVSSFGSLNAIIYTFSRVKQAIGQADILPWSRFWKQDDILQRDMDGRRDSRRSPEEFLYKSPQGGLVMHWIMSTVLILATIGVHDTAEVVGLPGYIQTYLHCAVLAFLSLGFLFNLKSREAALWPREEDTRRTHRNTLFWWLLYGSVVVYFFLNLAILVVTIIPPYKATDGSQDAMPGWVFPIILGLLILFGTIYYVVFFGAAPRHYERGEPDDTGMAAPDTLEKSGILQPRSFWNWLKWTGVQCEIRKDYTYDRNLERVYRFGRRWRIIYYLPGDDGYQPNSITEAEPSKKDIFWYWFFGGTRLRQGFTPVDVWHSSWMGIKRWFRSGGPFYRDDSKSSSTGRDTSNDERTDGSGEGITAF